MSSADSCADSCAAIRCVAVPLPVPLPLLLLPAPGRISQGCHRSHCLIMLKYKEQNITNPLNTFKKYFKKKTSIQYTFSNLSSGCMSSRLCRFLCFCNLTSKASGYDVLVILCHYMICKLLVSCIHIIYIYIIYNYIYIYYYIYMITFILLHILLLHILLLHVL